MKFSANTAQLISEIISFSAGKLKNEHDVSVLIEASSEENQKKIFEDLIFTAKYLNGLGKIIHSNRPPSLTANNDGVKIEENTEEKIMNEFKQHMLKFNLQLSGLIKNIPEEEKQSFEEKYLAMSRTALVNLTNLIYDLAWVKKYLNSRK